MSGFVRGFDTLSSKFHANNFDKNSFRVIQIYLPDRYKKQNQTEWDITWFCSGPLLFNTVFLSNLTLDNNKNKKSKTVQNGSC